jgi:hypothetical protein
VTKLSRKRRPPPPGRSLLAVTVTGPDRDAALSGECDAATALTVYWLGHYLVKGYSLDRAVAFTKQCLMEREGNHHE